MHRGIIHTLKLGVFAGILTCLVNACEKETTPTELPQVITHEVLRTDHNSAVVSGSIMADGGSRITARGLVWDKKEMPTLANCLDKSVLTHDSVNFRFHIRNLTPNQVYHVRAFATNAAGTIYGNQVSFRISPYLITRDTLPFAGANSIVFDPLNRIWIGTEGSGIYWRDGNRWRHFTTSVGLVNNHITCMTKDRQGRVWVGTREGISMYSEATWHNYTTENGLFNQRIYSLFACSNNYLWIGTNENHLTRFDGQVFTHFRVSPEGGSSAPGHVHAIFATPNQTVWVGSCYTGLSRYTQDQWTHNINGLSDFVWAILLSTENHLWIGHQHAIYRLANNTWQSFSPGAMSGFYSIAEDPQNRIWIACNGGIALYSSGTWDKITPLDGLLHDSFSTLHVAPDGRVLTVSGNILYTISFFEPK